MLVGNDNKVECFQLCLNVAVQFQGRIFTVDLHVLPLCEVDIILGVQWLKSLGPVLTDYNLTMKFIHEAKLIELKGNSNMTLMAISPPQLRRLLQTRSVSEFFLIRVFSEASSPPTTHPTILTIIDQF